MAFYRIPTGSGRASTGRPPAPPGRHGSARARLPCSGGRAPEPFELVRGQPPLEDREEDAFLEADVVVQAPSERPHLADGGRWRLRRRADRLVIFTDARGGRRPLVIARRKGRQDQLLLDAEVRLSLGREEVAEALHGRGHAGRVGPPQRERDGERVLVVVRERRERGRALHRPVTSSARSASVVAASWPGRAVTLATSRARRASARSSAASASAASASRRYSSASAIS